MQLVYPDRDAAFGWLAGPWNSGLGLAVGYSRVAAEKPHYHAQMREIVVVSAGSGELMVAGRTRRIEAGALVIVEAGEVHAWVSASRDFQMLVVHEPWVSGDTANVVEV